MRRRLLRFGLVVSLFAGLILFVLPGVSYWYAGRFHRIFLTQTPADLRIRTIDVVLAWGEVRIDDQLQEMPAPPSVPAAYAQGTSRQMRAILRQQQIARAQWQGQSKFIATQIQYDNQSVPMLDVSPTRELPTILAIKTRLGFRLDFDRGKVAPSHNLRLMLPLWAFPILPFLMAIVFRRLAKRDPLKCAKCGYDLRATPARCPECGTAPDSSPCNAIQSDTTGHRV